MPPSSARHSTPALPAPAPPDSTTAAAACAATAGTAARAGRGRPHPPKAAPVRQMPARCRRAGAPRRAARAAVASGVSTLPRSSTSRISTASRAGMRQAWRRKSGARLMRRGEEVPRVMPQASGQPRGHVGGEHGDVVRLLALRHCRQAQPRRALETQVLIRMDGKVDLALEQRIIDLGGEEFLAIDRRQRPVLDAIAAGLDAHQFDAEPRVQALETVRNGGALCTCQQRAARAQLDETGGHASNETEGREIFPAVRVRGVGAERRSSAFSAQAAGALDLPATHIRVRLQHPEQGAEADEVRQLVPGRRAVGSRAKMDDPAAGAPRLRQAATRSRIDSGSGGTQSTTWAAWRQAACSRLHALFDDAHRALRRCAWTVPARVPVPGPACDSIHSSAPVSQGPPTARAARHRPAASARAAASSPSSRRTWEP